MDTLTQHYLVAALWSSTGDDGEPLDGKYDLDDIAPESLAKAAADCEAFSKQAAPWVRQLESGMTLEQMGHDFWLTRNRHGAGFWDRGYPDFVSRALTELSHAFGEKNIVVGDDGKLHIE